MGGLSKSLRALFTEFGFRPDKALGQNFLRDERLLPRILAAAEISPDDTIIEVGAGFGVLTRALAERARRVVAVEVDRRLIPILEHRLSDLTNVKLVHADVLSISPVALLAPESPPYYKVVANLPYYITSPTLRHFLESEQKPTRMVVMLQREVAERIIAKPGDMSLLAVSVQFYARPKIIAHISRHSFYPPPEVDSALVRLDLYETPPYDVPEPGIFFDIVRAGFGQRRKQLRNSLARGLGLTTEQVVKLLNNCGINPTHRAEDLSLDEWACLSRALVKRCRANGDPVRHSRPQ
ncbi:MAG: ribosomal RNA small subunit methyltransferase A [Chloroflexi bacterium]|nr:ribosomal RNA small subunit methyltransferase A [Chloroflexota bacterium]